MRVILQGLMSRGSRIRYTTFLHDSNAGDTGSLEAIHCLHNLLVRVHSTSPSQVFRTGAYACLYVRSARRHFQLDHRGRVHVVPSRAHRGSKLDRRNVEIEIYRA